MKDIFTNLVKTAKVNSPEILTGLGVAGVVVTSYLTGKASYEVARDEDADPWMSNKEAAKRYWKLYIPAGISGVITIGCIIGSTKANGKRTAAAVTAYSLTERAFTEYKEKVVEQLGAGKEQKVRDEIAQDRINKNPPNKEVIILGSGHVLCCELYTHRYFRSEMEALRKAQNDINAKIINELHVTLDEFYELIGLAYTTDSSRFGWNSDRMMELQFSTSLSDGGEPCLAFEYNYVKPL